jgi:hypothetical protein
VIDSFTNRVLTTNKCRLRTESSGFCSVRALRILDAFGIELDRRSELLQGLPHLARSASLLIGRWSFHTYVGMACAPSEIRFGDSAFEKLAFMRSTTAEPFQ